MPTRVPDKSIPKPWLSFLGELDAAVETEVRLDCIGGFVVTLVYGFSRPTADLDVLEIAPREAGKPMLQLGMQGGPLHKKYKIYLDPLAWRTYLRAMRSGSARSSRSPSSIFVSAPSILTTWRCRS